MNGGRIDSGNGSGSGSGAGILKAMDYVVQGRSRSIMWKNGSSRIESRSCY